MTRREASFEEKTNILLLLTLCFTICQQVLVFFFWNLDDKAIYISGAHYGVDRENGRKSGRGESEKGIEVLSTYTLRPASWLQARIMVVGLCLGD